MGPSIKHESSENLKIKQFKMSESISKLEKEISKLKEGYSRHKLKDPTTANTIKIKLSEKEAELQRLRLASKSITREEGSRKNKSKLSIFFEFRSTKNYLFNKRPTVANFCMLDPGLNFSQIDYT